MEAAGRLEEKAGRVVPVGRAVRVEMAATVAGEEAVDRVIRVQPGQAATFVLVAGPEAMAGLVGLAAEGERAVKAGTAAPGGGAALVATLTAAESF